MEPRILVLGGTGLLGAPVARGLRSDGFRVRILSRDPEKVHRMFGASFEIAMGDAGETETLREALQDCWGVHVSIAGPAERLSAQAASSLAGELGLSRIGYVSGSTVDERNRWFPMVEEKLLAEAAVADAGVPWTIFRPTWPFETLARFVRQGRATVIGKHRTAYHWFSADDFARMVTAAYRTEEAAGKRFYIHGPAAINMHEALDRYREALHPDIDAVSTLPTWLGRVLAAATRNKELRFACQLMAYFDRVGEPGDPTEASRVLGKPTTTLDEWLEERKAFGEVGAC
ncbi:MAG: NAD(P)H-binding protein [Gemmatimonadota bacterium]